MAGGRSPRQGRVSSGSKEMRRMAGGRSPRQEEIWKRASGDRLREGAGVIRSLRLPRYTGGQQLPDLALSEAGLAENLDRVLAEGGRREGG